MRLDQVTAELRPRSDWESIDLGLALVRRDFWSLGAAWWLGISPVLLALPFLHGHPGWFCVLFWWWIPVASRMVLFKLSRRLFGDDPGRSELLRELPRAIRRRFPFRMLWARLSPWRPLTMAVEDLEGLRGKDYRARCRVLMRRGDSSVIVLALWRVGLTFWMAGAVFLTALLFVPEGAGEGWNETLLLWWEGESVDPPVSLSLAVIASFAVSLWLVDMFSVGAGFGIYVNHRTWVEGWDIELAFRRLNARLRGGVGVVLAGLLMIFGQSVEAAEPAKDTIQEVLADDDFEIHKETIKEPVPWDWDWNWGSGGGVGGFAELVGGLLKVLCLGGLIAVVIWLAYRYRHLFRPTKGTKVSKERATATVVMGMDVAPDTLPDDVSAAALGLWRDGRIHEAMSLLYRGGISWMISRAGVEIAESDTELDCLRRVHSAEPAHAGYFDTLTGLWMKLAYAREVPADGEIESLCRAWPFSERGSE